jgi:hypothetical protein
MLLLHVASASGLSRRIGELHDEVVRLAAMQGIARVASNVASVVIDERDFRERYGQTSPLDPTQVANLIREIGGLRPAAVVIALDLSPRDLLDADRRAVTTDAALISLARSVPVAISCPNSASLLPGMSPLEKLWVRRLSEAGVRFGRSDIDAEGLYLSAGASSLVGSILDFAGSKPSITTHACDEKVHLLAGPDDREPMILFPSAVPQLSGRDLSMAGSLLTGRTVVVGGAFGSGDVSWLRGSPTPLHSVTVQAWQLEQLLTGGASLPPKQLRFAVLLILAWLYATLLSWAWEQICDPRLGAAGRAIASALMVVLVLGGPLASLAASTVAARHGFSLGLSGLMAGVLTSAVIAAPLQIYAKARHLPPPTGYRWLQVQGWLLLLSPRYRQMFDHFIRGIWNWSLVGSSTLMLGIGLHTGIAVVWLVTLLGTSMMLPAQIGRSDDDN